VRAQRTRELSIPSWDDLQSVITVHRLQRYLTTAQMCYNVVNRDLSMAALHWSKLIQLPSRWKLGIASCFKTRLHPCHSAAYSSAYPPEEAGSISLSSLSNARCLGQQIEHDRIRVVVPKICRLSRRFGNCPFEMCHTWVARNWRLTVNLATPPILTAKNPFVRQQLR
jgi:hypothetical protein